MLDFKNAFSLLQKIGKCMMLPVSVLPVAGILLGVGSANFSWLPVEPCRRSWPHRAMRSSRNLPLLFAIGVAIGLTKNDGVAALAGTTGYVVFLAAMGVCAKLRRSRGQTDHGHPVDPDRRLRRHHRRDGRGRGVSTVSTRSSCRRISASSPANAPCRSSRPSSSSRVGAILSFIWPPIGRGIDAFSNWAVNERPALAFTIYGVVERALIPFGLHHVWNVPFFFEAGAIRRSGDWQ